MRSMLLRELREYRERISQELEAARRMQLDLLPARPIQHTPTRSVARTRAQRG
jgi:serine phosphatase RsbU (regulator of sigma subunit)